MLDSSDSPEAGPSAGGTALQPASRTLRRFYERLDDEDVAFLRRERAPRYEGTGERALKVIDLFAGCGGMTLGIAEAARRTRRKIDIRLALDFEEAARLIFTASFPRASDRFRTEPIEALLAGVSDETDDEVETPAERTLAREVGRADVLVGGPPCQGNSDLNNHTRRSDQRNALYLKMVRAAYLFEPELVVIENVPAVQHDRGGVVTRTRATLARLGYAEPEEAVVRLDRLGVPQTRRRHVLVAHRDADVAAAVMTALRDGPTGREPHVPRTVRWAIRDLVKSERAPGLGFDSPSRPTEENERRMRHLVENGEYYLPNELRPVCHRGDHSYKSVYGRLDWDAPAQTITTGFGSMGQGRYVHPARARTITPHEAARLQSFPDFYRFDAVTRRTHWTRAIGNAVPPFMMMHACIAWLGAKPLSAR